MNPIVEILRISTSKKYGTFGVMLINKEEFCVTLEPPDNENAPFVSNIPTGQYICKRGTFPHHGETFNVLGVTNRTDVLFHAGNDADDTEGCIILAEHFGKLYGNRAILNSGATFTAFMSKMKNINEFHLTIREVY